MGAKLSTVALIVVVGGVVVAAAVDSLNGHPASSTGAVHGAQRPARAVRTTRAVGTIVFAGQVESGAVVPGVLVATPGAPGLRRGGRRPAALPAGRRRSGSPPSGCAWGPGVGTPSGERIAVWASSASRPGMDGIYSRAAQGGALGRITTTPAGRLQQPLGYSPRWRPPALLPGRPDRDGRQPLRGAGKRRRRHPRDAAGRDELVLLPRRSRRLGSRRPDRVAAFAPGAAGRAGQGAVYVVHADGSGLRRITPATTWATTARWSPDGRWIAFDQVDRPDGAHDLFLVHPDGSGVAPDSHGDGRRRIVLRPMVGEQPVAHLRQWAGEPRPPPVGSEHRRVRPPRAQRRLSVTEAR